jgi:SOS-response transcriptional repressor LexA
VEKIIKELQSLKKGIDEAKTNIAKLDGREQETLTQLKNNYNLSSVEEIEKEIAKLAKEETSLIKIIEEDYKSLREIAEW